MRSLAFFFLALLLSRPACAGEPDLRWLALLHYSGGSSTIPRGATFFLAPEGHENPEAERVATLEYFRTHPDGACRFPARALHLGWEKKGTGEWCERWEKWRTALGAKGVELVFASAFFNSPSSMYGHTLLKFPRSGKTEGMELLDHTFNYGADTGGVGGPAYIFMGLTGGFNGTYSTAPFYLKVREYNHVENRDFWIYPLKLRPGELDLLVAHAWELRDVPFPYYFLKKNCSYYLLEFLEVARPGSNLTSEFPFWAVPIDTIRTLQDRGWLDVPHFVPSRRKRLDQHWERLNHEERRLVDRLADRPGSESLPAGRETIVLDAVYDLWRFRREGTLVAGSEEETQLLRERRKYPEPPAPFVPVERAPEKGHRSARAGIFGGRNRAHAFAELHYRGTLHDLLSPPHGYEAYSELTMGDLRARFEDERFYLERFDFLRIRAVTPTERWFPKTSWSFRFAVDRAKEMPCRAWSCTRVFVNGGGGMSVGAGPFFAFLLGEADAEAGAPFHPHYRVGVGPTGGVFGPLWPGARWLVEGEKRWRLLGERRQRGMGRVSLSQELGLNWEARAVGEVNRGQREATLGVLHYF